MIQWFPGHMHKASKEFKHILPRVDVVIEVLDARLPGSSQNPMLARLRGDKPWVRVLNKVDLADQQRLQLWIDHFAKDDNARTLCCSPDNQNIRQLPQLCHSLVPGRAEKSLAVFAMIGGIPNVGKSSLINLLAGRAIARTANEAAVTRLQQRIDISATFSLIDTPGMLWPNIINEASGYRLAATGAIRQTAYDIEDVAAFVTESLMADYPQRLMDRYGIAELAAGEVEVMEQIGKARGCVLSGGRTDFDKVSRLLLTELRNGELGQICLETPEEFDREMLRAQALYERKKLLKEEKRRQRRERRKK